ncbi:unnamed protein product [Caenorhabditis auriculariae]|uniref:SXP/RAL-2 family protein Ani s 5-like cation-binding domain-containing protein n=1 Tax=Caenorhabditis auriculariae TaxID=2777116 RepID=A0A8S1HTQ6_9PELO|nr:unnamed protein product [Caenorhabditis auriculariae]
MTSTTIFYFISLLLNSVIANPLPYFARGGNDLPFGYGLTEHVRAEPEHLQFAPDPVQPSLGQQNGFGSGPTPQNSGSGGSNFVPNGGNPVNGFGSQQGAQPPNNNQNAIRQVPSSNFGSGNGPSSGSQIPSFNSAQNNNFGAPGPNPQVSSSQFSGGQVPSMPTSGQQVPNSNSGQSGFKNGPSSQNTGFGNPNSGQQVPGSQVNGGQGPNSNQNSQEPPGLNQNPGCPFKDCVIPANMTNQPQVPNVVPSGQLQPSNNFWPTAEIIQKLNMNGNRQPQEQQQNQENPGQGGPSSGNGNQNQNRPEQAILISHAISPDDYKFSPSGNLGGQGGLNNQGNGQIPINFNQGQNGQVPSNFNQGQNGQAAKSQAIPIKDKMAKSQATSTKDKVAKSQAVSIKDKAAKFRATSIKDKAAKSQAISMKDKVAKSRAVLTKDRITKSQAIPTIQERDAGFPNENLENAGSLEQPLQGDLDDFQLFLSNAEKTLREDFSRIMSKNQTEDQRRQAVQVFLTNFEADLIKAIDLAANETHWEILDKLRDLVKTGDLVGPGMELYIQVEQIINYLSSIPGSFLMNSAVQQMSDNLQKLF